MDEERVENKVRALAGAQHQSHCASEVFCFIIHKSVPLEFVSRAENYLEVVVLDRLEAWQLDESEGFEIGLDTGHPRG